MVMIGGIMLLAGALLFFALKGPIIQNMSNSLVDLSAKLRGMILGQTGAILTVKECDEGKLGSGNQLVFFWGPAASYLDKPGFEFPGKGKKNKYSVPVKKEDVDKFALIVANKEDEDENSGVFDKAKDIAQVGSVSMTREILQGDFPGVWHNWETGDKPQLCIKNWNVRYQGKTVLNITYEDGNYLTKKCTHTEAWNPDWKGDHSKIIAGTGRKEECDEAFEK